MAIELTNIQKSFGDHLVVSDFSLAVDSGELFVLLGSSGSGKSTVLRMIAGLILPDSGTIQLHGEDVTFLPPQKRNTGFVFQSYAIFRHMTVSENVEFGLRVRKVPGAQRRRRSQELLDLVGLSGLEKRYASELSGGQRQRVALARALAYEPTVLLLDEPFGALDARIRSQLRRSLKDIQRELGVTAILVTHDQEEAFELADRIGIIEKGRLLEVGTAEDLYHRPGTEYAATFIGGGNVLVGRAEKNMLRLGQNLLPFPASAPHHEEGAPVRVLFRPEKVRVQSGEFIPAEGVIPIGQGILTERTFSGAHVRLRFDLEALEGVRPLAPAPAYGRRHASVEAHIPSTRNEHAGEWTPGERLWLGIPSFHVLEPSGLKLLICIDNAESRSAALETASRIESASHGPVTIVMTIPEHADIEPARQKAEKLCSGPLLSHAVRAGIKVRRGSPKREIVRETQEDFYDLVVAGRNTFSDQRTLAAVIRRLLYTVQIPVLIASDTRPDFSHVLVCLAADQSDTDIVRFGARLARHTGSRITLLHVSEESSPSPQDTRRIMKHLEQAKMTFKSHGVSAEGQIMTGNPTDCILQRADSGTHGLLLIGASRPQSSSSLPTRVALRTRLPVVLFPQRISVNPLH